MGENFQVELFAGVLKPVSVRDETDDRWDAALLDGCPKGLLSLVSGKAVALNLAEQYDAVRELCESMSFSEIAKVSGIHKSRVEAIAGFGSLPRGLQNAIREEKIKTGIAKQLLRLGQADRVRAMEMYWENGKLTAHDLNEMQRVKTQTAQSLLPNGLFEGIGARKESDLEQVIQGLAKQHSPDEIRDLFESAYDYFWCTVHRRVAKNPDFCLDVEEQDLKNGVRVVDVPQGENDAQRKYAK